MKPQSYSALADKQQIFILEVAPGFFGYRLDPKAKPRLRAPIVIDLRPIPNMRGPKLFLVVAVADEAVFIPGFELELLSNLERVKDRLLVEKVKLLTLVAVAVELMPRICMPS